MKANRWACVASVVLAASAVATGAANASTVGPQPQLTDPTKLVYTAVDADGGVYWRYLPGWSDTQSIPGWGFYTGDRIQLQCFVFGGPAGPNGNTLWYIGTNLTRPADGKGWINDHYLNTPGTAANPQPVNFPCGNEPVLTK